MSLEEISKTKQEEFQKDLSKFFNQLNDVPIPDEKPTVETKSEDDHVEKLKAQADLKTKRLKNAELENNIKLRGQYASKMFYAAVIWMIFVAIILVSAGINKVLFIQLSHSSGVQFHTYWGAFHLSDGVLIALVSGCSANVLGLWAIVARYLFPPKK